MVGHVQILKAYKDLVNVLGVWNRSRSDLVVTVVEFVMDLVDANYLPGM